MQSRSIKEIKAALWRQAFIGDTWVSCDIGQIVAIRRRKGKLLAMVRGWKHWHTVESVTIEGWLTHRDPAYRVLPFSLLRGPTATMNRSHDEEIHCGPSSRVTASRVT